MLNNIKLNEQDYQRFETLLKVFGTKVEHDVHWHLTTFLSEIPYPFMRVYNKQGTLLGVVSQII